MSLSKENRPGGASEATSRSTSHSATADAPESTVTARIPHLTPAPVSDGLASWCGPLMHPDSPEAVWREYGRPPAPPWGSYLDETPLPMHPDRRGPVAVAMDTLLGVTR